MRIVLILVALVVAVTSADAATKRKSTAYRASKVTTFVSQPRARQRQWTPELRKTCNMQVNALIPERGMTGTSFKQGRRVSALLRSCRRNGGHI